MKLDTIAKALSQSKILEFEALTCRTDVAKMKAVLYQSGECSALVNCKMVSAHIGYVFTIISWWWSPSLISSGRCKYQNSRPGHLFPCTNSADSNLQFRNQVAVSLEVDFVPRGTGCEIYFDILYVPLL